MRSFLFLSLLVLLLAVNVSCFRFMSFTFPRPETAKQLQTERGMGTVSAPPTDKYTNMTSIESQQQHTLLDLLKQPHLLNNSANISWVFNLTATHLTHLPIHIQRGIQEGFYTMWIPDDHAMRAGAARWEKILKKKYNFSHDFNIERSWNMTETNQTVSNLTMEYVHASLKYHITPGFISLFALNSSNLLPSLLVNDSMFVNLGFNVSQKLHVLKGFNHTAFGHSLVNETTYNHTDVMLISGSGRKAHERAHVYRQINAKNGIIYIMDGAPDLPLNFTHELKNENATQFLRGLNMSHFLHSINNMTNVTLLVPTDEAINRTLSEIRENPKFKDVKQNEKLEQEIIKGYILPGVIYASDILALNRTGRFYGTYNATTLSGFKFPVSFSPSGVVLNGNVSVVAADVLARGGVIHFINDTLRGAAEHALGQQQ